LALYVKREALAMTNSQRIGDSARDDLLHHTVGEGLVTATRMRSR
jgi:hypothetical protein